MGTEMRSIHKLSAMQRTREEFSPVVTSNVAKLIRRYRVLKALRGMRLVGQAALDLADSRMSIAYGMSNSKPWQLAERLRRYEGLVRLVERAESLGVTFRVVPAGWFELNGDIAATYNGEDGSYVFFENQPIHALHTTDTICHEIVHATGPRLKRVKSCTSRKREDVEYWMEEGVAVLGALRLGHVLDLPRVANDRRVVEEAALQALEKLCGHRLNRALIDVQTVEAVNLLVEF